jgi:hypothetical protein
MDIPRKVEEMADRLNDKYYGRLELSVLDPSLDPSLEEQVDSYNVLTLRWPSLKDAAGNEVVPPGHASAGLVVEKGDKFQTIQLIRVIAPPKEPQPLCRWTVQGCFGISVLQIWLCGMSNTTDRIYCLTYLLSGYWHVDCPMNHPCSAIIIF